MRRLLPVTYLHINKNRINHQITAKELRVIDDAGENLGVISKEDALKIAIEKGLDLIEISPEANPPVAKILSFDKFRYLQEKEAKKTQQKTAELKHVRISARSAENDLRIKAKQADKFMEKGNNVEIMMVLRGREKGNKDWARERLANFLSMIETEYKVIASERFAGRGMNMQISKK